MGAATCAAVLQPLPISHHFHGCTALLVLRFVVAKFMKYLVLSLPFYTGMDQELLASISGSFDGLRPSLVAREQNSLVLAVIFSCQTASEPVASTRDSRQNETLFSYVTDRQTDSAAMSSLLAGDTSSNTERNGMEHQSSPRVRRRRFPT